VDINVRMSIALRQSICPKIMINYSLLVTLNVNIFQYGLLYIINLNF